jgi:type IX secretion system PorP/SprF family membrane protein
MNIKKFFTILILCQVSIFSAKAQDPYFSQYFMSPMTSNPSLTGKGITDTRVLTNFRSEVWGSGITAFKTNSFSIEKRIATKKLPDDELAVGLTILSDDGSTGVLKKNYISFVTAFNKRLSKNSFFGAGIAFNYSNLMFDRTRFQDQSQFGSFGFQSRVTSSDPLAVANTSYLNTDAGINYSFEDDNWGLNFGFATFHVAKNKQGISATNEYVRPVRYTSSISTFKKYKGGDELHFIARMETQGVIELYTLGSVYKMKIPGEHPIEKLNVGVFNTFDRAVAPYVGFESTSWFAGFSYGVNNNSSPANYALQSMEITLGWQFAPKKGKLTHQRMVSF